MAEPRKTRPVSWLKAARHEFEKFPEGARMVCLTALTIAAEGGKADIAKPCTESVRGTGNRTPIQRRCVPLVYALQLGPDIWVIHAFQKKSTYGNQDTQARDWSCERPAEAPAGDTEMKREESMDVVRGTGNVFRDLGSKNPDADQFKAILATEIIKALDREHLSVRRRMPGPGSLPPTSPASAMPTSTDSLWTAYGDSQPARISNRGEGARAARKSRMRFGSSSGFVGVRRQEYS